MKVGTVQRYTLLGALYFAQGLPFGFFVQILPLRLREANWSLGAIGFASLLALPWALKFLWAPLVDRVWWPRLGRRRTWILAMQLAGVIVLGTCALLPDVANLTILMTVAGVLNLVAATQDIASDGMAVELLPPNERGLANGLQVGAYRVGMIVGGGALLIVGDAIGLRGQFAVMAALTALASLPVILTAEPPTTIVREAVPEVHFLKLPGVGSVIAVVMIYKFGESFGGGMLKLFLKDGGMTDKELGTLLGTVGFFAGMVGALLGGALVERVGRYRSLVLFGIGQVITVAGYAYLAFTAPSTFELYLWTGVEHLASGMATAALFTSMMDWSRPRSSGTDYTVQASAVVIAQSLSPLLAGFSAQALGYAWHFTLGAVLCVVGVLVVIRLYPRTPFPRASGDARSDVVAVSPEIAA